MKAQWYVCEGPSFRSKGGFCLYSGPAAAMMEDRQGLCRCIKHGALLGYDSRLDGMTRDAARRALEADAADPAIW